MTGELERLARLYDEHCQRIEPRDGPYTFATECSDNGAPHVGFSGGEFQYIVTERGLELERRSTADSREILYWMLYDLTFWMAVQFEKERRVANRDARRLMFAHWMQLMQRVDDAMAARLEQDVTAILAKNPYDDSLGWT